MAYCSANDSMYRHPIRVIPHPLQRRQTVRQLDCPLDAHIDIAIVAVDDNRHYTPLQWLRHHPQPALSGDTQRLVLYCLHRVVHHKGPTHQLDTHFICHYLFADVCIACQLCQHHKKHYSQRNKERDATQLPNRSSLIIATIQGMDIFAAGKESHTDKQ